MFLSTNSTSSKIPRSSCVIMWVLGLHKVHGEESIVVLLVHGELSSSCSPQPPPLAHLGSLLLIFINQLVHLFSFLFTLSLITSFFIWRAISLLNKVHSNLKLPLLTLTTYGSFLFLVLLSSLNLSLSDSPQSRHIPASDSLLLS
ncbi:unnamed protein product [Microthlaspi erraticum]|uniref:Uncharacterized protein n=1 Tax=Microthlaspi erraticum TaxID=1685480 RepID=A0A6D2J4V4_9BRAS|nr:unnamed protein product [Microthlaspi erraticum]